MNISAGQLPFRFFRYSDDRTEISFSFQGRTWACDISDYQCREEGALPLSIPGSVNSPDGRYAAFIRDHNLWVFDRSDSSEVRLTEDGEEYFGYAVDLQGWTRSNNPILKWSPDSRWIATFQQDDRGVGKMPLIRTSTGRPVLDLWPYALPGDTVVPMLERVVIDVENGEVVRLEVESSHQRTSNCCGLVRGGEWADIEWSSGSDELAFVSTSRDYSTVTLYVADPESGSVRKVYSETDEIFFESNLTSRGTPNWSVLHESNEFIWFTRADNWGHLYLHDLETGKRKNRITAGDWNVIDIMRIDEENRSLLITGVGKEEERDGETDLYGLLIKPSDFDPEKTYPIVNSIYPGPQVGSVGTRSFSTHRRGQAHALAELCWEKSRPANSICTQDSKDPEKGAGYLIYHFSTCFARAFHRLISS